MEAATQAMVDELMFAKSYIEAQIQAGAQYEGLAASQARSFVLKIKSMKKLDNASALKIADAINASLFSSAAKQEMHTTVSMKVCSQPVRPNDIVQTIDLENYFTADEWEKMSDDTMSTLNVAAMASFRLKSLGVFNPTEKCYGRIAAVIAMMSDQSGIGAPTSRLHDIYCTIKRIHVKTCFRQKRDEAMPFISTYPTDPNDGELPTGFIALVYAGPNDGDGPIPPPVNFTSSVEQMASQSYMRRPRAQHRESAMQMFAAPAAGNSSNAVMNQFMGMMANVISQAQSSNHMQSDDISLQFNNAGGQQQWQQQQRRPPTQFQLTNVGNDGQPQIDKRLQLFRDSPASSPELGEAVHIAMGTSAPSGHANGLNLAEDEAEQEEFATHDTDDDDDGAAIASNIDPLAEMQAMVTGMAKANALAPAPVKSGKKATRDGTCSQYGYSGLNIS